MTDSGGAVAGKMKYYPYGSVRAQTGAMGTDKLFTGQPCLPAGRQQEPGGDLGLYDYGARFYSTLTGRFVSPDPLISSPGDPQMLNRYSYVRNNPLNYVDPSGLCFVAPDGEAVDCSPDLWLQILDCAINGGASCDVEEYGGELTRGSARAAIRRSSFWKHFKRLQGRANLAERTLVLLAKARGQNISGTMWRLRVIPDLGWEALSRAFGAGTADFFRASLIDILHGGHGTLIRSLSEYDIFRASRWWLQLSATLQGKLDAVLRNWSTSAASETNWLDDKTRDLANAKLQAGVDINELSWSADQRRFLRNNGFDQWMEQRPDWSELPPECLVPGYCIVR